jgi:acyl-CoA thioester hydrolase
MSERKPAGRRADYRAFRTVTTRWMDNDAYGHVNNAAYYSFIDTAVTVWLIDNGILTPGGGGPIGLAVETGCRYFSAIAFPDTITAGIRIGRRGTSSVRYEVGLFRNEEDTASAEGHFVHVYVDPATRRPVPLPEPLARALDVLVV